MNLHQTFFKNRDRLYRIPMVLEPYGQQVNLLPGSQYRLIQEIETGDDAANLNVETAHGQTLVVYPNTSGASRLYRVTQDGLVLVWSTEEEDRVDLAHLEEYTNPHLVRAGTHSSAGRSPWPS